MEYANLGRSGLRVSRLCLGTGHFGSNAGEGDSHAIMDKAFAAGINMFDTGDVYGGKEDPASDRPGGLTEAIIGKWIAKNKPLRQEIVLATKVWGAMGPGPNDRGLSAYHIRRACEESLRRLQTDHIDLYQMHSPDWQTPAEEIWQAMEQLIQQGKILYVGSSNFPAWHFVFTQAAAKERHLLGLVSEQARYNLADRRAEKELIPAIQKLGAGLLAYSPLGSGLLGGILHNPTEGQRASYYVKAARESRQAELEKWEAFCRELGEAPTRVALAWLLANPAVTAPIIGPRLPGHLEDNLKALELRLDETATKRLNDIWPA